MADFPGNDTDRPPLGTGARVEVRTGFDRSWASGFEVESTSGEGYRVRRRTDGRVLPTTFGPDDIRHERSTSMWWY